MRATTSAHSARVRGAVRAETGAARGSVPNARSRLLAFVRSFAHTNIERWLLPKRIEYCGHGAANVR